MGTRSATAPMCILVKVRNSFAGLLRHLNIFWLPRQLKIFWLPRHLKILLGCQDIFLIQDHSRVLCEQLQQLRLQSGLVDLDIVCEVIKGGLQQRALLEGFYN